MASRVPRGAVQRTRASSRGLIRMVEAAGVVLTGDEKRRRRSRDPPDDLAGLRRLGRKRAGGASVEGACIRRPAVPSSLCQPSPGGTMIQTARQCVGAVKYTRYTLGSLSAVLFAACAGGS